MIFYQCETHEQLEESETFDNRLKTFYPTGLNMIRCVISYRLYNLKNVKNTHYLVKKTRAIRLTHVTYETDHVSLLQDSTVTSAQNFCFYVFYCNLKEKGQITRNLNSKKRNIYAGNQYYYYFGWPKTMLPLH